MANQKSLFDNNIPPLPERMRPSSIEDYIGQSHLTEEKKILSSFIDGEKLFYKAELTKKVFFCVCKQTNDQPFCDGSHNKK